MRSITSVSDVVWKQQTKKKKSWENMEKNLVINKKASNNKI